MLVLKHKSFTIVDISAPGVKLPQPLSFQRPIEKHQLFAGVQRFATFHIYVLGLMPWLLPVNQYLFTWYLDEQIIEAIHLILSFNKYHSDIRISSHRSQMLLLYPRAPRVVVSTAAFHAGVRGSVPGLGGLKETKCLFPIHVWNSVLWGASVTET